MPLRNPNSSAVYHLYHQKSDFPLGPILFFMSPIGWQKCNSLKSALEEKHQEWESFRLHFHFSEAGSLCDFLSPSPDPMLIALPLLIFFHVTLIKAHSFTCSSLSGLVWSKMGLCGIVLYSQIQCCLLTSCPGKSQLTSSELKNTASFNAKQILTLYHTIHHCCKSYEGVFLFRNDWLYKSLMGLGDECLTLSSKVGWNMFSWVQV